MPANLQKKVHIVLLNWNNEEDTLECIKSLQEIDYNNYETIIVDNGSEKESVLKIKKEYPEIKIIENKKNIGFAGGNNVGIKYAMENGADYVLLLNNDTTVEKDFLNKLVEKGESDEKNGLVGAKIYFHNEPDRIWFAGGKVNWLKNKGTHIGLDEIDKGQYDEIKEVDYLTGCCLLIKKEVIEKISQADLNSRSRVGLNSRSRVGLSPRSRVGLSPRSNQIEFLAEDYFLYYEDTDFCLRAKNADYKCLYVPQAKIYHKISRSTKPGSAGYIYYHVRNGLVMAKRTGSLLNKFVLYFYCVYLFLKQIVKIIFFPKKRNWAFAVLKGEKDFLMGKMGKADF